jgi:hypothetical protein
MFDVKRPEQKPIVIIRAATAQEFSNYEKHKLANIENGAQVNKIELIELSTPSGEKTMASTNEKVAKIELGELSLKDKITPDEISDEELFLIECSLGE